MNDYEDTLVLKNTGHFFPVRGVPVWYAHGYEYNYLFYHCPPKYGHPPPPLLMRVLNRPGVHVMLVVIVVAGGCLV